MGCAQSKPQIHAYYEPNGTLVSFKAPKSHDPKAELVFVSSQDTKKFKAEDECYIISSVWLDSWLEFAMKKKATPPGSIHNQMLLNAAGDNVDPLLKPKRDFRPIGAAVWEYLFQLYGGGPVITFKVPGNLSEDGYAKGSWIKEVKLNQIVTIINPNSFPKPTTYQMVQNPMSKDNAAIAANLMLGDLGKNKMRQAKELQNEINQENADAIAALMAKDLGKKKMEEARLLNEQANQVQAEAIANQLAGGLSEKLKKQANEANEGAKTAQSDEITQMFSKMGAKKRFKEALKSGNMNIARDAAATMLKNAWRGKKARQKTRLLKEKKQRLMEESMARKLQSKYRSRLARKKVERLKAERQKLREEGCAIMVQSAWRIRKSRQKVARLKAEKQRLLEEGSALMVQSAWRIKQAKRRVNGLKNERNAREERKKKAILKISSLLLLVLARLRYRNRLRSQRHTFIISLKSATGINIGDVMTSDPYVFVHGEAATATTTIQNPLSGNNKTPVSSPIRERSASSTPLPGATVSNTLSLYRSKTIMLTLNPTWNEECIVTNTTGYDDIVFTLMDKDQMSADDFLGQTVVSLKQYPQLMSGKEIKLNLLPINSYKIQPHDSKGKPIAMGNTETPGKGNWFLSIRMPSYAKTHSGWVQKQSSSVLGSFGGSAQFKLRFMVLCENKLQYYEDAHSLDHSRGSIFCNEIKSLKYGPDKSGENILEIVSPHDTWHIKWVENETNEMIASWLRKLEYNCKGVTINNQGKSLGGRTESMASTASITPSKPVAKAKRSSMFFGGSKN